MLRLRFVFAASRRTFAGFSALQKAGGPSLDESDPEMAKIIRLEQERQVKGLELIPSENYASKAAVTALGSIFVNKYAEGYAGARYYGGNEVVDMSERLCMKRALAAFGLDENKWGVNVQSLSGSPANFAVYTALLRPHDRIMALDLPHGGHLSHGFSTPKKKVSAVSVFWEQMPYQLDANTGRIDYDTFEKNARLFRPKLVVAGASAYARHIDYQRMKKVCDEHDAYLLADMAHIAGLVAAGLVPSPFEFADVVTTTTHKTLRGPRGALIFYRKGTRSVDADGKERKYELEEAINSAVFPGLQGGPHQHTISAIAVALGEAAKPEFKQYAQQVLSNCQVFAKELLSLGYDLVSGGTDNHLVLMNLTRKNIDGQRVEKVLELCGMHANKNTVPGDVSAMNPHGLRMGTPALTTRGLKEEDFRAVAGFVHRGIQIALAAKEGGGKGKLKDFKTYVASGLPEIEKLRNEVEAFAQKFPIPGVDTSRF